MLKRLNWKRGLFRLWMLSSALWCAYMGYGIYVTNGFLSSDEVKASVDMTARWETQVIELWIAGFIVPLAVLAIGFLIIWIGRGFKASNEGLNWKDGFLRLWAGATLV